MARKNRDHVAVSNEYGVGWIFAVGVSDTTGREQATEMAALCERLFESFGDFLRPLEITYEIREYPAGHNPLENPDAVDPIDTIVRELSDGSGISASEFVDSTQVDQAGTSWIPRIPFHRNKLRVNLDGSDRMIDRTDCVLYHKGEVRESGHTRDPLQITVSFISNRRYDDIDSDYVIEIRVRLSSDLWLERTDQGRKNRGYLAKFLERLSANVSEEQLTRTVYRSADFWYDLQIQELGSTFDPEVIY